MRTPFCERTPTTMMVLTMSTMVLSTTAQNSKKWMKLVWSASGASSVMMFSFRPRSR